MMTSKGQAKPGARKGGWREMRSIYAGAFWAVDLAFFFHRPKELLSESKAADWKGNM